MRFPPRGPSGATSSQARYRDAAEEKLPELIRLHMAWLPVHQGKDKFPSTSVISVMMMNSCKHAFGN
jgi:hypothetical protein